MRYALKNNRPGETYFTPAGIVHTSAVDGGATLTAEQKKYFEDGGHPLVKVADVEPDRDKLVAPVYSNVSAEEQARLDAQLASSAAAAQENTAANKAAAEKNAPDGKTVTK